MDRARTAGISRLDIDWRCAMAAALLVIAVIWASPAGVTDADALSRLAMGRMLAEHCAVPKSDPFTFGASATPFGDPEWLGDLAWYVVHDHSSQTGLQATAIAIACVGYVLALLLGVAFSGDPRVIAAMLLCTLAAAAPRVNARNDLHLLWLLPLLGMLLLRTRTRRPWWLAVVALLWVWANLHSSYLIAAIPIASVALQRSRPIEPWPWLVLLSLPLLPFTGFAGGSGYLQLVDHAWGSSTYRSLLSEWRSPLTSSAWLAVLPLHVLCIAGIVGFWRVRQPSHLQLRITLFVMGCSLAYSSRRFLPLMVPLIVPAIAPEITQLAKRLVGRSTTMLVLVGACLAAGLLGWLADNICPPNPRQRGVTIQIRLPSAAADVRSAISNCSSTRLQRAFTRSESASNAIARACSGHPRVRRALPSSRERQQRLGRGKPPSEPVVTASGSRRSVCGSAPSSRTNTTTPVPLANLLDWTVRCRLPDDPSTGSGMSCMRMRSIHPATDRAVNRGGSTRCARLRCRHLSLAGGCGTREPL